MFRDDDIRLSPLLPLAEAREEGEPRCLQELLQKGLPLVETWVAPAWLEDEFYRLAGLDYQLKRIFAGVWGVRIDEEALARASERAEKLVRETYLLAERAEKFVAALPPGEYRLRRPGSLQALSAAGPQQALWRLKNLWAGEWSLQSLLARGGPSMPAPAAVLLQRAPQGFQAASREVLPGMDVYESGGRLAACIPTQTP